jgi:hypothetical protein
MNAEKAPKERQSRLVFGFVKLKAKIMKTAVLMITRLHRPYAGIASCVIAFPRAIIWMRPGRLIVPAMMSVMHEQMHQRAGCQQQKRQHAKDMRGVLREQEKPGHNKETAGNDPKRGPPPRQLLSGYSSLAFGAHQRTVRRRKKL